VSYKKGAKQSKNVNGHSADAQPLESTKPHAAEAETTYLIDKVVKFIKRFVFLRNEADYVLVAAWIVATYLHKNFEFTGYLFAYSPEPQSGKTTLLKILDMLVYKSTGVQLSPTEAVMFRTAAGQTHLLDEVDSWQDKENLRSVLNAGYQKGAKVTRCEKNPKGSFAPQSYTVYAPRALAGIGLSILPPATLDRTFAIPMVRQTKKEKRERLRETTIRESAKALKARIDRCAKLKKKEIAELYVRGDFPYLDCFSDRTMDISEPLAAVIEILCQAHPEMERIRHDLVSAIARTRKEQHSQSPVHTIIKRLLSLAETTDPLVGNATELATKCKESGEAVEEHAITHALRTYGFKPKSVRMNGGNPLYRYSLSKAELQEIVDRWITAADQGK
jgi:Protein of unknown function (DUF3631)